MTGRQSITRQLLQNVAWLLLLPLAGCSNKQPSAPTPSANAPQTTNVAPSNTQRAEPNPAPLPSSVPQIAQPMPVDPVPSAAEPHVDAPLNSQVRPQISQQNLYSGGQPPQGMPRVILSEQHALTCPVQVGQYFPEVSLPDQTGKSREISKLRGKFTLIVLWSAAEPTAVEELGDLEAYAYQPYKNVGLNVIAIHTAAGKSKLPGDILQKIKPTFTTLNDSNGELWTKLGKGNLPRTFLLDGQGKVLWFDIEYSRTTRRQLQQALQAVMQEI